MTEMTCKCGKPTRDDRYVCDACSDDLARALGDIAWLDEELETTITKRKGVDYRRVGGGSGGKREQPSPPEWTASNARTHLKGVLVAWVRFCADEDVRHSSPHLGLPVDELTAISRWLLWRVDGLSLHDIGAEAVDEITSAVAHCHRLIDRPADRQFLGRCEPCEAVGHEGRLYARPGGSLARCSVCGDTVDAERLREKLLHDLDDRLCTAAEIAHLSTYLGLQAGREQVRKRINQWHKRERITAEHAFAPEPVFRFGIVWRLLQQEDEVKAG
jgi:hypothetical protein